MSLLLSQVGTPPVTTAVFLTPTLFWGPLGLLFCAIFLGGH